MQKEKNRLISYLLVAIYVISGSLGMVLIKKGGLSCNFGVNDKGFSIKFSWVFLIGLLAYVISFLLWIYILQVFTITYISPVVYGMVFISVAILSYYILGAQITKQQIIGATFIVAGILIASIGNKS